MKSKAMEAKELASYCCTILEDPEAEAEAEAKAEEVPLKPSAVDWKGL